MKDTNRESISDQMRVSEEKLSYEDLMRIAAEAEDPVSRLDARWAAAFRLIRRELEEIADQLAERNADEGGKPS